MISANESDWLNQVSLVVMVGIDVRGNSDLLLMNNEKCTLIKFWM